MFLTDLPCCKTNAKRTAESSSAAPRLPPWEGAPRPPPQTPAADKEPQSNRDQLVLPTSVDIPAIKLTHTGSPRISSRSFLPIRFPVFLYFISSDPTPQIIHAFPSAEVLLLLLKKSHGRNPGVNQISAVNDHPPSSLQLPGARGCPGSWPAAEALQVDFPTPREARDKSQLFSRESKKAWCQGKANRGGT